LISKSKKPTPNPHSATANQHCAVPHCTTNQPVDCDPMRDPTLGIGAQRAGQLAQLAFNAQIDTAQGIGQLAQQGVQEDRRDRTPALRDLADV